MSPPSAAPIYDEMNRVIAALHTVDVNAAGLAGYGKPGNYFERQIGRWSKQYLASITEPIDAMDRLMEWLPAHIPASAGRARCPSCTATTGWTTRLPPDRAAWCWRARLGAVTLGHPLADFSYHCMAWHIRRAFRGIGGCDLAALGIPRRRATTSTCTASAPAAPTPMR